MDPLSITVSVFTLIQVATSLTKTLRGFDHSIKNIDTRVDDLCGELERLTTCLKTVQETLDDCQHLHLVSVGETLWQQCGVTIADCNMTLSAMRIMTETITGTEKRRGFLWKTKAVVNWNEHTADLAAFSDKLHKSHLALQTVLQTISVSTSLKNHDSIELVHLKLDILKRSIDDALGAALRPHVSSGLSYSTSDMRFTTNLRKLLEEARQFHSAASSEASTIRDGTGGPWMACGDQATSVMGDFPHTERQWVENYVRAGRKQRYQSPERSGEQTPHRAVSPPRPQSPSGGCCEHSFDAIDSIAVELPTEKTPDAREESEEKERDHDDHGSDFSDGEDSSDAETERAFQFRLHELAIDRFRSRDYLHAVDLLQRALNLRSSKDLARARRRQLQIQLALGYFLRGDWKQAGLIVSELAKMKCDRDSVVCTLLHTLSLAHLFHYSFDSALDVAQQALRGRRRLLRIDTDEVDETLSLLATIHEVRGGRDDYIHAYVLRGQVTEGFEYRHPKSELMFITGHPTLLPNMFGGKRSDYGEHTSAMSAGRMSTSHHPTHLPRREFKAAEGLSPLSIKATDHWRYEQDTMKCAVSSPMPAMMPLSLDITVADDDLSTNRDTPTSSIRRGLTRLVTPQRSKPIKLEDVPDASKSPTSSASPISHWRKGGDALVHTKSRNLLRKRSGYDVPKHRKKPMSFGFLSKLAKHPKEATGSEDEIACRLGCSLLDRINAEPGSRRPLRGLPQDDLHQSPMSGRHNSWFGSLQESILFAEYVAQGGTCYPCDPDGRFAVMDTSPCAELMDTGRPHELSDTALTPVEAMMRHRLITHSTEVSRGTQSGSQCEEIVEEAGAAIATAAPCRLRTRPLPPRPIILTNNLAVESLTGKLAGLFAALSQTTDMDERHDIMVQLSRLLPLVTSICNDSVLAHDIRGAIKTHINSGGSMADDAISDSAYETMVTEGSSSSESSCKSGALSGRDNPLPSLLKGGLLEPEAEHWRSSTDNQRPPSLMNKSHHQGANSPVLERAYSFSFGVEDHLHRRCSGAKDKFEEEYTGESRMRSFSPL